MSSIGVRRALIADAVRTRLWPVPAFAVALAVAGGIASSNLDRAVDRSLPASVSDFLFGGGPSAAREVLGAIASSLITVTSLTFSLTLVILQLASSQFSPRLLRTFAGDRFVQRTLALFLATFVYALTVLRTVRDDGDTGAGFVPKISVTLAYLLTVVSVVGLVLFLGHLVREIRVETMLDHVASDAVTAADDVVPRRQAGGARARPMPAPAHAVAVRATATGFLTRVDEDALVRLAVDADAVVDVRRLPGDWLVAGTPVAVVWARASQPGLGPDGTAALCEAVAAVIHTGSERTPLQDVGFALRQLTDVAAKALSPGINDPTTAVHALGHSSSLLCELARRDLGPKTLRDEDGDIRVIVRRPELADLLELAVGQPIRYGVADTAVAERLYGLLREVAWFTEDERDRQAVAAQLGRLRRAVARQDFDGSEVEVLDAAGRAVAAALAGDWT